MDPITAPKQRDTARAVMAAKAGAPAGETQQYLTFVLGNETFAVGIGSIKEIIEYGEVTTIPMMPVWIRGVIDLRGAAVPVLDLASLLGRSSTRASRRTCIVIVEVDTGDGCRDVGIVVDAVNAVLEIPDSEIEPPPDLGAGLGPRLIRGMGKVDGRFVIILDAHRVLSEDQIAVIGTDTPALPAKIAG
jgi:purine-binding chemotaxis protein CheW